MQGEGGSETEPEKAFFPSFFFFFFYLSPLKTLINPLYSAADLTVGGSPSENSDKGLTMQAISSSLPRQLQP